MVRMLFTTISYAGFSRLSSAAETRPIGASGSGLSCLGWRSVSWSCLLASGQVVCEEQLCGSLLIAEARRRGGRENLKRPSPGAGPAPTHPVGGHSEQVLSLQTRSASTVATGYHMPGYCSNERPSSKFDGRMGQTTRHNSARTAALRRRRRTLETYGRGGLSLPRTSSEGVRNDRSNTRMQQPAGQFGGDHLFHPGFF
jgi:hypothetical protein